MKIALCGNRHAGKSTFAQYLRDTHGFYLLNHTDEIKRDLASSLAASDYMPYGSELETSLDFLQAFSENKEKYRPLIIEWAKAIGANEGNVIRGMLQDIAKYRHDNIIIDNIRFPAQADICKEHGFVIVRLLGGTHTDAESDRSMDGYEAIDLERNTLEAMYDALQHAMR